MEKIDYKAYVDKAIGEKPSLAESKEQPQWLIEADRKFFAEVDKKFAAHFSPPSFTIDDVGFTKQSLLFNDKQDTK